MVMTDLVFFCETQDTNDNGDADSVITTVCACLSIPITV